MGSKARISSPGSQQREQGGGDGLGGSRRDEHLRGRIEGEAPEARLVIRDRLPQRLDPGARGVLVLPGADGVDRGLGHLDGPVLVGEALAEVDGTRGVRQRRHLREDRRPQPVQARGQGGAPDHPGSLS